MYVNMKPEAATPFLLKPSHLCAWLLWRKQGTSYLYCCTVHLV